MISGKPALIVAVLLSGLFLASPAMACNEGRHSSAASHPRRASTPPLEIGDSTSIIAAPLLGRGGIESDAHGCRQFAQAIGILRQRRRAHRLAHVVVLALGANGPIAATPMRSVLSILGPTRVLALVTARRSGSSNAVMRHAARAHPGRVVLIDWVRHSAGHGGWFAGDGLHVGQAGAQAYAAFIRRSIAAFAFPPVARLHLPRHSPTRGACGTVRRGSHRLKTFIVRGRARMTCARARELIGRAALSPIPRWRAYDWRSVRRGPWRWVYEREDGNVLVGATDSPASSASKRALGLATTGV